MNQCFDCAILSLINLWKMSSIMCRLPHLTFVYFSLTFAKASPGSGGLGDFGGDFSEYLNLLKSNSVLEDMGGGKDNIDTNLRLQTSNPCFGRCKDTQSK